MIDSPSATGAAPWLADPRQLWSLFDMIEFFAGRFNDVLTLLRANRDALAKHVQERGPGAELNEIDRSFIPEIAKNAEHLCDAIGLVDAGLLASELHRRLTWWSP